MATDIELSSCSSSIIDSGFENYTIKLPMPPPRKKHIKYSGQMVTKLMIEEC